MLYLVAMSNRITNFCERERQRRKDLSAGGSKEISGATGGLREGGQSLVKALKGLGDVVVEPMNASRVEGATRTSVALAIPQGLCQSVTKPVIHLSSATIDVAVGLKIHYDIRRGVKQKFIDATGVERVVRRDLQAEEVAQQHFEKAFSKFNQLSIMPFKDFSEADGQLQDVGREVTTQVENSQALKKHMAGMLTKGSLSDTLTDNQRAVENRLTAVHNKNTQLKNDVYALMERFKPVHRETVSATTATENMCIQNLSCLKSLEKILDQGNTTQASRWIKDANKLIQELVPQYQNLSKQYCEIAEEMAVLSQRANANANAFQRCIQDQEKASIQAAAGGLGGLGVAALVGAFVCPFSAVAVAVASVAASSKGMNSHGEAAHQLEGLQDGHTSLAKVLKNISGKLDEQVILLQDVLGSLEELADSGEEIQHLVLQWRSEANLRNADGSYKQGAQLSRTVVAATETLSNLQRQCRDYLNSNPR